MLVGVLGQLMGSSKIMSEDKSSITKSFPLNTLTRRRDRKAVAALHEKYFSQIKHHITSRIGSVTDAEDLAQDVFVEFYKGNGCYKDNGNPEKYLFGITDNLVRGYYRKKAHSVQTIPIEEIGTPAIIHEEKQYSNPTSLLEKQELRKIIEEAVEKLPPKARQALELRFIKGLDSKEASKRAGCTAKTFRHRFNYAIHALKGIERRF
jgi:RNA polymerase sigma-70 factor (ECF subfamily)